MGKRPTTTLSATRYMQQVRLPLEFQTRVSELTASLLDEARVRYQSIVQRDGHGERIDSSSWKLLKQKNQLSCYRSTIRAPSGDAPELMALGDLTGSLEDVLYGIVNYTPESMLIENAYAQSDLIDSRVLAILQAPSTAEPFTAMTVKWILRNHSSMTRQSDYVYVESTGMTTLPTGERVGYLVAHSVEIAAVPEFRKDSNITRGHVSYCYLYRQRRQHSVEMFYNGFVNPRGAKERAMLTIGVDMILGCASCPQYSMMKKLSFSLRSNRRSTSSHGSGGEPRPTVSGRESYMRPSLSQWNEDRPRASSRLGRGSFLWRPSSLSAEERPGSSCCGCKRSLGAFSGKVKCELCDLLFCSRCRIVKRVYMQKQRFMNPVKLEFCMECIALTNDTSATWIAGQELQHLEHLLIPPPAEISDVEKRLSRSMIEDSDMFRSRPVWAGRAMSLEERQTMSSDSTWTSSTNSSGQYAMFRSSRLASNPEEPEGMNDEDSDSGDMYGSFIMGDDDDDEDEYNLPIIESFVEDEFDEFEDADQLVLHGENQ